MEPKSRCVIVVNFHRKQCSRYIYKFPAVLPVLKLIDINFRAIWKTSVWRRKLGKPCWYR